MAQLITNMTRVQDREKALKILAKSIFKELRAQGFESREIVGLATELIAQVTSDLASEHGEQT